ncbi:MAG: asparagine synthase (glutamine-hydrolyzing) [Candidatus Lindowbacteria bacterium]|nr:asparagine synthase (glutamine-hydrolyzing) [Candidatus Lindowbacteria bacterium]
MCGIAGCFGSNPPDPDLVNKTLGLMKNRGPNNTDYVTFKNSEFFAGFLHSRLSIIDLDERSNQPFQIDDVTLVHNGEIYNYVELRKELEKDGVVFQTDSDTEVLLQSYLKWGEECVDHFEGMWAFAIYDVRDRKIFISRDRFGEKPLFYSDIAGTIYFASETKFIRSLSGTSLNVCTDQILRYLVNGYKSLYKHGQTFFDGVNELPPAHNMRITKDGGVEVYRYWTPTYHPKKMSLDEAIEGVRHHLKESVKLRLRSDVPLAFCLSGGIDSTSIISIAVKEFGYDVATFSIVDQDERYNETDNMNAVINDLGCKNTMIDVPNTGFLDRMEFLIDYHDSPLATISYYVHAYLSEAIAESGFKWRCPGQLLMNYLPVIMTITIFISMR